MPSPFPGMDPYLEHPDHFPSLHHVLITGLLEALQQRLPEPYFAKPGQRVWIESSARYVEPDVDVLRPQGMPSAPSEGGIAVAAVVRNTPIVVQVVQVPHDEHEEAFMEIYTREDSSKRLVAAIEVLSPANKSLGSPGYALYRKKQQEVLASKAHLVEIDLLRGGEPTTAVPHELAQAKVGPYDYHVCVHRFDEPPNYYIYPIQLPQRLPEIQIPLLPGDPAVALDLQAVFDWAYDTGPYRREINYREDPIIPRLPAKLVPWAAEVVAKGLAGMGT